MQYSGARDYCGRGVGELNYKLVCGQRTLKQGH
jgi:hypothetical protein